MCYLTRVRQGMSWQRWNEKSVSFFFFLRYSGYISNQRITDFYGVRLTRSFAWLTFLGWHRDKAVSFWGISTGWEFIRCLYEEYQCLFKTLIKVVLIKRFILEKTLKDRSSFSHELKILFILQEKQWKSFFKDSFVSVFRKLRVLYTECFSLYSTSQFLTSSHFILV